MTKRRYWTGTKRAPAQDKFFIAALDPDLWAAGDKDDWDACWHTGMPAPRVYRAMTADQRVNHIPGNNALTVKSMLYQSLDRVRARAPAPLQKRLSFFPRSYLMPDDYHALQREAFAHPEKRWIVKPKSLSRGRGIAVIADAGAAPTDDKQLVQEYLSAPHLFDGRKYVLRCYLVITSVDPLRVYLYKEGFVKLASEAYRDADFDNLYAHLTNPDVNALNAAKEDAVVFYSFAEYKRWLADNGRNADALFYGLRDIAVIAAIAARETMRMRIAASGAYGPGCYELIGMDCLIDADLKPWLLECNLSPSLDVCAAPETGGVTEENIKGAVVRDLVSLVGLNEPKLAKPEPCDIAAVIADSEREFGRAGDYERVYPGEDAKDFFPFFGAPRFADVALAEAVAGAALGDYVVSPRAVDEFVFGDDLTLAAHQTGRMLTPSPTGAYIWLRASKGDAPDAIASDLAALAQAQGDSPDMEGDPTVLARQTVWETLADWARAGVVGADGEVPPAAPVDEQSAAWAGEMSLAFAGRTVLIRYASPEIAPRLRAVLGPLAVEKTESDVALAVMAGEAGYAVAAGPLLLASGLALSAVAGAICDYLFDMAAASEPEAAPLSAGLWRFGKKTLLIARSPKSGWDSLGFALMDAGAASPVAGAVLLHPSGAEATGLPLPMRSVSKDRPAPSGHIDQWTEEQRGALHPVAAPSGSARRRIYGVILPSRNAAVTEPRIETLAGRAAFLALSDMLRGQATAHNASALAAGAKNFPIIRIAYRDTGAAVRLLTEEAVFGV